MAETKFARSRGAVAPHFTHNPGLNLAILLGILLSSSSFLLEEISFRKYPRLRDYLVFVACGVLENPGYRQLHSWWRWLGVWDYRRHTTGCAIVTHRLSEKYFSTTLVKKGVKSSRRFSIIS